MTSNNVELLCYHDSLIRDRILYNSMNYTTADDRCLITSHIFNAAANRGRRVFLKYNKYFIGYQLAKANL